MTFDRNAFEQFLVARNIRDQVRELLLAGYNKPLRNVKPTPANTPGGFPSPKTNTMIQFESWRVEYRGALDYLYRPSCLGFLSQAFALDIAYPSKSGRRSRHRTVVDYLVCDTELGVCLDEWKPDSYVERLIEKYPGRYELDDRGHLRSPVAEAAATDLGLTFRIRLQSEVSENRFRNYLYLLDYRLDDDFPSSPGADAVRKAFQEVAYVKLDELSKIPGVTRDDVYGAIAHRILECDWDGEALPRGKARVFRNADALEAHLLVARAPAAPRSPAFNEDLLLPGTVVSIDGMRLTITVRGASRIYLTPEGSTRTTDMAIAELERLYLSRAAHIDIVKIEESPPALVFATPGQVDGAVKRLKMIDAIEAGRIRREELPVTDRTLRDWKSRRLEARLNGADEVDALIPRRGGFSGSHIAEMEETVIEEFLEDYLSDPVARLPKGLYGSYRKFSQHRGGNPVSLTTFRERMRRFWTPEIVERREGKRRGYQVKPFYPYLYRDTPVHGDHPFAVVHMDSTELECTVVSIITGQKFDRAWKTVAIDAYDRVIAGYYLSLFQPNGLTPLFVAMDIVRRHGRIPSCFVFDGGREFDFTAWYRFLSRYRCSYKEREGKPRVGSLVERLFGTSQSQFIHGLYGNTKLRRVGRMQTALVDGSTHAGLTLADLYWGLDAYYDIYHRTDIHPALLMTPQRMFERGMLNHGTRASRLQRFDDEFIARICPFVLGMTRKIDGQRGIWVDYEYYSPEHGPKTLDPRLIGEKVPVRRNPFDPGVVFVAYDGQWHIWISARANELSLVESFEKRAYFEELRMLQHLRLQNDTRVLDEQTVLVEKMNDRARARRHTFEPPRGALRDEINKVLGQAPSEDREQKQDIDSLFKAALARAREGNAPTTHIDEL